jgi:hypothetical protein
MKFYYKKLTLILISFHIILLGISQKSNKIVISGGVAFRGVPINVVLQGDRLHIYDFDYDGDEQFESTSFSIDFKKVVLKNKIFLQSSNYFRYNYFREKGFFSTINPPGMNIEKRFKTDHFLDVIYQANIGKKDNWKLKIGLGYGVMNTGTGFTYPKFADTLNPQGNLAYTMTNDSFLFWAPRLSLGISYKKINLMLSVHKSKNQYNTDKFSLWIETKFAYEFSL